MASTSCEKTWTLTVGSPVAIAAYWTLNEALGNVNRVDSVSGLALAPLGVTDAGAPALFSNGLHYTGSFGGKGYQAFGAPLAYTAPKSWSAWGWFKITAEGNADANGGPAFNFAIGTGGSISIAVGSITDPGPVHIFTASDQVYQACTLSDWHFFHLFYNGSNQKFGYSIDNAGIAYLPTVIALASSPTGFVTTDMNWQPLSVGDILFDEVGVLTTDMLTPAQQAYLYNSGIGRTWPIALP